MGFWPFGGGKRQRVVESDEHGHETLLKRGTSSTMAQQEKYSSEKSEVARSDPKAQSEQPKTRRLSKNQPQSTQNLPYAAPLRSQTTPVRSADNPRRTSRTESQFNEKGLYQQNPMSQDSLGPENFTVVRPPPTLHAKRSENDSNLPRRKSSKRKAEDIAREREIRALSSSPIPIPKRPATLYGTGPLQRDSRQIPGPLNRRLERPTSEISLPMAGSLSDVSNFPNQHSFKVGILAALSPRPTVKYDANPKFASGKQPARSNMSIRQAIAEDDVDDKKRIDELADDLDAKGLHELMERDRRRRERKKEAEKAKLQRKLRRAERQREEDARRARTEAFVRSSPTPSKPRGLGIESPKAAQDAGFQDIPTDAYGPDPFSDPGPSRIVPKSPIRNPFEDEKDMDIMQDPQLSDEEVEEEAIPVPVRSPERRVDTDSVKPREQPSQSTLSPPVSPVHRAVDRSSLSQASFLHREATPDIPESSSIERRTSDQSSQRLSSWTTFFRRGTRRKLGGPTQGRTTPEFSNTSRESFSRKQLPVVASRTFRRSDSATPQRTMSRFREDLPELPISPPDSRFQSPEATVPPAGNVLTSDRSQEATPSLHNTSSARDSSGMQMSEQLDQSQRASAGMVLSQSLASVDSEASWLSGKPPKRSSGQLSHAPKPSQSSITRHVPGAYGDEEDDDLMDEDFYSQLGPASSDQPQTGGRSLIDPKASSTIIDLGSEPQGRDDVPEVPEIHGSVAEEKEKRHEAVGKQPVFVQQAGRMKSQEGLLGQFTAGDEKIPSSEDDDDDNGEDSASPDAEMGETSLLRAQSVDYKGHARHISAGSAKLFDVKRASVQSDLNRSASARKSDLELQAKASSSTAQL